MSDQLIPKLLTPSEVSTALRVSKKTIYRWIYERKLPFLKLNGKLLFKEQQITEFIELSRSENCFQSSPCDYKQPLQSSGRLRSRKGSLK